MTESEVEATQENQLVPGVLTAKMEKTEINQDVAEVSADKVAEAIVEAESVVAEVAVEAEAEVEAAEVEAEAEAVTEGEVAVEAEASGEEPSEPEAPKPLFSDFPISDGLKAAVAAMGYIHPTDVQVGVFEAALAGKDVVVQAKTGSGKTSAFGIPIIERFKDGAAEPGLPRSIILTPTRELAHQVADELRLLAEGSDLKVFAVYGGVSIGRQATALREGVDVVVGTPGRLLDHLRRKNMGLDNVKIMVLDEADEMLSMGFWDDVTGLLKNIPGEKQTMLFSATLPYQIAKAAAEFLKEPERIDISGDELTVDGIDNNIYQVVSEIPKPRQLLYLLEVEQPSSAIIFCNTRNETEMIAKYLTQSGFIAEPLMGSFRQRDRERVMGRIKSGELRYMVATDIAARGIDIEHLSNVYNYSLPEFSEVYLHRVGRTGRAGKTGSAMSMVDGKGLTTFTELEREFGVKFETFNLPDEDEILRARSERIMKELQEKASVAEVGQHLPVAEDILKSEEGPQMVAFLLKAYFNSAVTDSASASTSAPAPRETEKPERKREARGRSEGGDEGGGEEPRRRRRRRRRRGRDEDGGQGSGERESNREPRKSRESNSQSGESGESRSRSGGNAEKVDDGYTRLRVNLGFEDGFKGRGAVAKKISVLAGLNDGLVSEVESRRHHAVLKVTSEVAELLVERVNGAQIGKKILEISEKN
jgi:ATP-dependent RNA helicase DeaD